jgi:hypothetical protein
MKKYFKYILIYLTVFVFAACSCSKNLEGNMDLEIEIIKVDSWLNLMPGGPGSFHISGDFKFTYKDENEIVDLDLTRINIYQDEKILYSFRPFFTYNLKKTDTASYSENAKEITFGTSPGLPIVRELDPDKPISAELEISSGGKNLKYMIDDITVEKAY